MNTRDLLGPVSVPETRCGPVAVERFEITRRDVAVAMFRASIGPGRGWTTPGTYTRLVIGGQLWMSDTEDELRDHWAPVHRASVDVEPGARALITGLGLGVVVQALLRAPRVAHVDVVEIDPDVIAAVGPHYAAMAEATGTTLRVIEGDAFTRRELFAPTERWALVWHDVWARLDPANLAEMATLHRRYARHCDWQGSWGRALLLRRRRREARA